MKRGTTIDLFLQAVRAREPSVAVSVNRRMKQYPPAADQSQERQVKERIAELTKKKVKPKKVSLDERIDQRLQRRAQQKEAEDHGIAPDGRPYDEIPKWTQPQPKESQ